MMEDLNLWKILAEVLLELIGYKSIKVIFVVNFSNNLTYSQLDKIFLIHVMSSNFTSLKWWCWSSLGLIFKYIINGKDIVYGLNGIYPQGKRHYGPWHISSWFITVWFYERLCFDVVIGIVKDKKKKQYKR